MNEVARLVCPQCKSADGLWASASFEGWHAVDVELDGARRRLKEVHRGRPDHEVDHGLIDLFGDDMGCSCGWTGHVRDLVQLGIDGQPLPQLLSGQQALC